MTGTPRRARTRKARRSTVERSAQCRSSTTSTNGSRRPGARPRRAPARTGARPARRRRPARLPSRVELGQQPRELAARRSEQLSGSGCAVDRASARRMSTSGASGRPPPPSSTHAPVSTRGAGPGCARRRLLDQACLPDPGLPATSTIAGSPAAARSIASASTSARLPADEHGTDQHRHGPACQSGANLRACVIPRTRETRAHLGLAALSSGASRSRTSRVTCSGVYGLRRNSMPRYLVPE